MKHVRIALSLLVTASLLVAVPALAKERLGFAGGPEGGTFQYFSNGFASRLSKTLPGV